MPETSVSGSINVYPSQLQKYHELSIMWLKANVDAATLTPEEYLGKYKETYEKIQDADKIVQKKPGLSNWY